VSKHGNRAEEKIARAGSDADGVDSSRIVGALLKFSKGDYLVGPDGEDCQEKELVAVISEMIHGWIRWEDNRPVEQVMGRVADGFVPPERSTLSHTDPSTWELDANGKRRDVWQRGAYLPMLTVDAQTVYTFTTSSDGGRRRAVGPLCGEYGQHIRQHPDELPIIGLEQDSYQHPDRSIGRVKYPLFPIKRWVKADKYIAALVAATGRSTRQIESS
jgi:hypothetical protein